MAPSSTASHVAAKTYEGREPILKRRLLTAFRTVLRGVLLVSVLVDVSYYAVLYTWNVSELDSESIAAFLFEALTAWVPGLGLAWFCSGRRAVTARPALILGAVLALLELYLCLCAVMLEYLNADLVTVYSAMAGLDSRPVSFIEYYNAWGAATTWMVLRYCITVLLLDALWNGVRARRRRRRATAGQPRRAAQGPPTS